MEKTPSDAVKIQFMNAILGSPSDGPAAAKKKTDAVQNRISKNDRIRLCVFRKKSSPASV